MRAEKARGLEGAADLLVDPMHFGPGLRDDDRGGSSRHQPDVFGGQSVGLFASRTRNDGSHGVEAFEGL